MTSVRGECFWPLFLERRDQRDPFIFEAPAGAAFRYYINTTGTCAEAPSRAIPFYFSDNLFTWRAGGWALATDGSAEHWAPYVRYIESLEFPYVMLYSRGQGLGELGNVGHRIYRAESKSAEGPFVTTGVITAPGIDFAIDHDVFEDPQGRLTLTFATDFVHSSPFGTGLAEVRISGDLSRCLGEIVPVARASAGWQLFEAERYMPWKVIPGITWQPGETVRWYCLEAPCSLYSPTGRRITLYSGGCYEKTYAVGKH